ncbi:MULTISPECIES: cysteine desulfurase family protein [Anaerococcus]|uniref:Cysteine desulfurase n=1 Tax=Anaerococcus nagyae TaxID=1755241 RepID=A0A3E2TJA4_9FIRM|nr:MULTISPECIES: cysteine desulfurase family protein [Anaerococcus]MDU1829117.1 cysteine desulfurase family protein [Anaerococcus sp.]MDU1864682.1 cysteine desulfurase family protein [Anaerococcus sp.]MDU2354466.1 cysteine desulfurase family protein [Anaerococcus sp.]MDU2566644.1 cysteine desulfurase family protein [Anaerococcus sp.]MDU3211959.1 cysteine desulfurase family protein [Anaerococcus sp.]
MIYFDNAATAIKREEILKNILKNKQAFDGNPDSLHTKGREAKKILEDSRKEIAKSIGANPKNIIFTSGATEGNNTIINAFRDSEIITSSIEHDSILNTVNKDNTVLLNANKDGIIDLDKLKDVITEETKLVAIMYVNNETGAIQPVKEIGDYLRDKNIWFHVDSVQAYGHIDIDVDDINCDSLTLSGHKIGGLNGFGILYLRENIAPFIKGGEQEKDRRAGTSFVAGAYSMAESYPKVLKERSQIKEIKNYFIESLDKAKVDYELNGNLELSSDHVLNIYFKDYKSDFLLTYLDINGICASAGSACRAGSILPSHVISNMYDKYRAEHSIRFSFGYQNTRKEVDETIAVLERLVDER